MNFFKGLFRLVKITLVSMAIAVIILLLGSVFPEERGIFDSFIPGFIGMFAVCVINSFGAETLDLSWLNNGFGTFIKRALFFISWIIALAIQVTSLLDAVDNALLGNSFVGDIAILCFVFAPFAAIYMCHLVSNSVIDASSMTFFPVQSILFGVAAGLVFKIIFNVIPALQGTESWLIPVLSNVSFIIFMIIRQELPYTDFSTSTSKAKSGKTEKTYQSPPQEDDEETDSRKSDLSFFASSLEVEMYNIAQRYSGDYTSKTQFSYGEVYFNIVSRVVYSSIYFEIRPSIRIEKQFIEEMNDDYYRNREEHKLNLCLEEIRSKIVNSAEQRINKLRQKYKDYDNKYSINITVDPIFYM